jgi:hypothetical protein
MLKWRLSEQGAILIYLILLSGVGGVLLAWKMLPKSARLIEIHGLHGESVARFAVTPEQPSLRYKIDDTTIRVYARGESQVFPMVNISSVTIE